MSQPRQRVFGCPLERQVAEALDRIGVVYTQPDERRDPTGLDFRLPNGVEIEVKRQHTDRVNRQLAENRNVILLQGPDAVRVFCDLITASVRASSTGEK